MKETIKNLKNRYLIFKCRLIVAILAGFLGGLRAAAAGNGMAGINEATSMVTSYFDPGHQAHLCHRCSGGSYRRHQGLFQVVERRPRHEQDRRIVVRSVHFPYCRRHNPPLVLPLIRRHGRVCYQQRHRTVGGVQGTEGAVSVHFRRRPSRPVRGVRHHVYRRSIPMDMYRIRRYCRLSPCVAHLPPQCQVRAIRSDEVGCCQIPSSLYHQPSAP